MKVCESCGERSIEFRVVYVLNQQARFTGVRLVMAPHRGVPLALDREWTSCIGHIFS